MPELNPYGQRALERWRTCLPEDYQRIPEDERTGFFSRLGDEIDEAVSRRAQELMDQHEPDEPTGFRSRLALLTTLRADAEREVLAEMLPAWPAENPAGG
jgi:hypothetical protein